MTDLDSFFESVPTSASDTLCTECCQQIELAPPEITLGAEDRAAEEVPGQREGRRGGRGGDKAAPQQHRPHGQQHQPKEHQEI